MTTPTKNEAHVAPLPTHSESEVNNEIIFGKYTGLPHICMRKCCKHKAVRLDSEIFLQSLVYAIDPTTSESEACEKLD